MQAERERATKARELAEWFWAMAADDESLGDLMACAACALELEAEDEPQDAVPEIPLAVFVMRTHQYPSAMNDNERLSRRRTKH